MALPFIVGPHQCSLTHGPEGRPQVEVVFRLRLPLAELFDALLLSLADQRPLFQQPGHVTAKAPTVPAKAGPQTFGHTSPKQREEAPSHQTAARFDHPKRSPPGAPTRSTKHAPAVDPTHEKLLAALSQATGVPDTTAVGTATTRKHTPTSSNEEMRKQAVAESGEGPADSQAAGSIDPMQHHPPRVNPQSRIGDTSTRDHIPPPRAFAHPKKCPVQ